MVADDVITWYDSIAGSYDKLYGGEQALKVREIISCLTRKHMEVKGIVVDIGCGTGALARFGNIAPRYYIGIDLSVEMLKYARRRLSNAEFISDVIAGDAASIPLRKGVADAVFSISAFRASDDMRGLLNECVRICGNECILAYTLLCSGRDECLRLSTAVRTSEALDARWKALKIKLVRRSRELIVVLIRKLSGA